ncbi:hypothetical protein FIE12Z_3604 [Fusarium flagelliforme]|uniref:Uncharacterized protein n=1 Tax=Fusarium flagelliforme TaxID=2675880 RepID=A0A395MVX9_9HYPO|nr:hypothetical protein FIE12Z_3604 [Fusarium flagelliforme]
MENSSSSPRQTNRRPQPSLPQVQIPKAMSEPTFSPTGLLGDRYDLLRQEMEERSRSATNRPRDSPFNGGLLGALEEYENQQIPRGQQAGWSLARALSRRSSRGPDDAQYVNRPRRTSNGRYASTVTGYVVYSATKTTLMESQSRNWAASSNLTRGLWGGFCKIESQNIFGEFIYEADDLE